jgi:hypothetical protein
VQVTGQREAESVMLLIGPGESTNPPFGTPVRGPARSDQAEPLDAIDLQVAAQLLDGQGGTIRIIPGATGRVAFEVILRAARSDRHELEGSR